LIRKNKVFALPSIAAAVLGASVFSVSVFECMFAEEKRNYSSFGGFRGRGTKGLSLFKP